jgi:DNA helicase HerA-like ATPase
VNEILGFVAGRTFPHLVEVISSRPLEVGDYVEIYAEKGPLLGMVDSSSIKSRLIEADKDFTTVRDAKTVAAKNPRDMSFSAKIRILGLIKMLASGIVEIPATPPKPGCEVYTASEDSLKNVFTKKEREWASIGYLAREENIYVSVNVDKLASRHLAILAATGSGKSNLLALIAKKVSELNGTMVIFDYHGEYGNLELETKNPVQPKISPRYLDSEEFADVMDVRESASHQRGILAECLTKEVREAKDFWEELKLAISKKTEDSKRKGPALRLLEIVERARRRMGQILDPDFDMPLRMMKPNKINIVDMLELTEKQANVLLGYYLEEILEDRKKATRKLWNQDSEEVYTFPSPVICAIEEAHTFIPQDEETRAKYAAAKVAREGRKFGLSLVIISQRPSRIDQDVLSQMGSMAVMRIIQPADQNYIVGVSENLSEEIANYLPSLNTGEAILLGQWVTVPVLVKIFKVGEKLTGSDISAVKKWEEERERKQIAKEKTSELIEW